MGEYYYLITTLATKKIVKRKNMLAIDKTKNKLNLIDKIKDG